jgi:hypothetical protein
MLRFLVPIITALLLVFSSVNTESGKHKFYANTVNAVIGDKSFEIEFGLSPDAKTSEETRIKTHLNYVIGLLESADSNHLNQEQIENRSHIIGLLKGYVEAGQFPKNHYFENRRPVFIDRDGNLCAVGYLIAKTEGLETAQKINDEHKFDYIKDIDGELINDWLIENGLTKKEAAMIQPAYRPIKQEINRNNIETGYAIGSSLLAGAQLGALTYGLLTDNSPSDVQKVSAFNAALGAASLTLGLFNIDNSYSETSTVCPETSFCIGGTKTTYTNQSRTNLSIANIIIGGASATFNGIRFFRAQQQKEPSGFNVSATQVYDPSSGQSAPALSLSYSF